MNYWFFMSYARLDFNPTVKRFYDDLADTIRRLEGGRQEDVGFFDVDKIKNGDVWTGSLAEALQTSRSFVPIYSASYFDGRFCGKEWEVFRTRIAAYPGPSPSREDHPPALILPVLWVPEENI